MTDHTCKPMTPTSYDKRFEYRSASDNYVRDSIIHPSIEGRIETEVWQITDGDWRTVTFWVSEIGTPHSVTQSRTGDLPSVMEIAKRDHAAAIAARRPEMVDVDVTELKVYDAGEEVLSTPVIFSGGIVMSDADLESIRDMAGVAIVAAPGDELKVYDAVDNPRHYQSGRFGCEAIDLLRHCTYAGGNAIKYVWRHADKGKPVEDLRKAVVYASWVRQHGDVVVLPGHGPEFFGLWNAHVRHRLSGLPDVYRAMDYLVRLDTGSSIHLINRTIIELTDGTN